MSDPVSARPVNQKIRFWILRLVALACLPLILLSDPVCLAQPAAMAVLRGLGTLLVVAAVLGRFWAILYIGGRKNQQVVSDGPYSLCRHPLYLSTTIGTLGLGLVLGSVVLALLLAALALGILTLTAQREERFLRSEFGAAYAEYAARVPRILPRPSGFRTPREVTFNTAVLRTNLADALAFLVFVPLVEILNALKAAGWLGMFPIY